MIATIETLDGFTFQDNLTTSHQVDCMSSVLIPAEAVKNGQKHFTSFSYKVGSIMPLV